MKALPILNKYFNDGSYGVPKKSISEFKAEVDRLATDEKNDLARLAASELGVELD